ncbi:class I SAM-dependent methyltransferase [Pelagibacteraceae bacterium]|nr:class I SAM-dependent methyltransferase [Pelagibacteraceae bacterium]
MKSLTDLAIKYKTDKHGIHFYTKIYEKYMLPKIDQEIGLLEIGVGGYDDPQKGGESLKMWADFFSKGKIFSLDYFEKKLNLGSRIKIFKGSQSNSEDLMRIINETGELDFIIDDGSHINRDVIYTFKTLFKFLKHGGYYFIEDTQTSYMPEFGGDAFYLKNKKTLINFFKEIVDKINYMEIKNPFYQIDYFAKNITEIHFYHNLIVIKKNKNDEVSNVLDSTKKYKNKKKIKYIFFIY